MVSGACLSQREIMSSTTLASCGRIGKTHRNKPTTLELAPAEAEAA